MSIRGKPITFIVAGSSAALALSLTALLVQAYHDPVLGKYADLVTYCSSPVLFLLVGAFLLMRGSGAGRVMLGFVFVVLTTALIMLGAFSLIALGAPLEDIRYPLVMLAVLVGPTYLLLFSRRLGQEIRASRAARLTSEPPAGDRALSNS